MFSVSLSIVLVSSFYFIFLFYFYIGTNFFTDSNCWGCLTTLV